MRNILKQWLCCLIFFASAISPAHAGDPIDDVFALLDTDGGVISGNNELDGYYIVALGTAEHDAKAKGIEAARISALKQLNEMVNGIAISGSDTASFEYIALNQNDNQQTFSEQQFISTVKTSFHGHLSAAKTLRSGEYDGYYFSAVMIAESDVKQISLLAAQQPKPSVSQGSGEQSVAEFEQVSAWVEAKGIGSLKRGEKAARVEATNDAIRNAVQQAQGVMVQGKSGLFNEAIAMAISTKTQGYVKTYEIQDEEVGRGSYRVIIMAEVDSKALLNDVSFYTKVLGQPVFTIESNGDQQLWLAKELERLGFKISANSERASHTFKLIETATRIEDHKKSQGYQTELSLVLINNDSGDILFTINNNPNKTRIFVAPITRAQQVSKKVAYKQLKKQVAKEVIQSLAKAAEKGFVYAINIKNANKKDFQIFKHVLTNGATGELGTWTWQSDSKTISMNYVFRGPLSEVMDQALNELYASFKSQNPKRRLHLRKLTENKADFEIVRRL